MNILTIDTSTSIELIALSVDGRVHQFCEDAALSHSVTMFQNISRLLSEGGISINDVDLIGTGTGPGSFTGIRIAVSAARMLSQVLEIPLVGIKSQEIYAASVQPGSPATVIAAFDAKKGRVFGGVYDLSDGNPTEIIEPGDYRVIEIINMTEYSSDIICIGDGCGLYQNEIKEFFAEKGNRISYIENFLPDGESAVSLTLRKYNASPEIYIDYSKTVPFYSRLSDAEILKKCR